MRLPVREAVRMPVKLHPLAVGAASAFVNFNGVRITLRGQPIVFGGSDVS